MSTTGVTTTRVSTTGVSTTRRRRAAILLLRLAIAAILLATAVGKLLDVAGFAAVLTDYRALAPLLVWPVAVGVPIAELVLGVWLLSGRCLVAAALVSAGMHLAYTGWAAVAVLRGLRLPNCGCFGVFLARPLGWSTVAEDAVMVGASLTLALLAWRRSTR